jgi:hypothetical protein
MNSNHPSLSVHTKLSCFLVGNLSLQINTVASMSQCDREILYLAAFLHFRLWTLQDSVKSICDFNESLNPIFDYITCCELLLDAWISDFFLNRLRGVNSYQMSQCWSYTLNTIGSSQHFLNIVALSTFKSQEYCQWSSNHAVAAPSILCVHLLLTLLDLARIRFMSFLL